jgi:probable phosphoglycerate mutase
MSRIFAHSLKLKQFSRFMNGLRVLSAFTFTLLLLGSALFYSTAAAAGGNTVIYLVRHAEKVTDGVDPILSAAGRERARVLADLLEGVRIDAIHSTDFRRTRETARPLAQRIGRAIDLYDPDRSEALVADILSAGGRHLVVGHSNTVPELVVLLGGDGGPPIDEAAEYDRLYVVTRTGDGAVQTELRRYGARFSP